MIKNNKTAIIALWITAVVWGTGFVGTDFALQTGASALLITSMRFLIASFILLIIFNKKLLSIKISTIKTGTIAGILLLGGFTLQTFGQSLTTVSNSSFITSTTVIMVPFIVWIIEKKRPEIKYFILALTAMIGACILTVDFNSGFELNMGDIIVLISAGCFAMHIAYLGKAGKGLDSTHLTFIQLTTIGILSFILLILFEAKTTSIDTIIAVIPSTVYLALFSSCLCYYFQTTAQQYTKSSKAALILCMEGFFGSLFAIILGIDTLTTSVFIGGACIITSVILSEVDF